MLPDGSKDSPVSLALQTVPPSLVYALPLNQSSSLTREASLRRWQGTGITSFSLGLAGAGRTIAFWPLGGTVVSIVRGSVLWLDTSQLFKMEGRGGKNKVQLPLSVHPTF